MNDCRVFGRTGPGLQANSFHCVAAAFSNATAFFGNFRGSVVGARLRVMGRGSGTALRHRVQTGSCSHNKDLTPVALVFAHKKISPFKVLATIPHKVLADSAKVALCH